MERKYRARELQRFIAPKYVGVAFNLPPSCGTFWGLMEEEIDRLSVEEGYLFSKDVENVLSFLTNFFSVSLVETIRVNMEFLQNSYLGMQYTLRPGKAGLAINVLRDVQMECDVQGSVLQGFLGHVESVTDSDTDENDAPCDAGDDGWHTQRRRQRRSSASAHNSLESTSRGASNRAGRGVGAGRGAGGGRGSGEGGSPQVHFESMQRETVVVLMSPFSTPPYGDLDRHQTLKARSWEFVSHAAVEDHSARIYNPNTCETGSVYLFHGTRNRHLEGFQRRGIAPLFNRNEFSMREAFYVSNSIRQTYEHPLHYHPSRCATDTIAVFVFEVDVRVLHGIEPPPGERTPFTDLWFPDNEENLSAWRRFCKNNFTLVGLDHSFDIVIGPVCLPRDEGDYGKMEVRLPRDAPFTQIAFCSMRARSWLESCFKKIFVEARGVPTTSA